MTTNAKNEAAIAELRAIAERAKKLRDALPADSRGLGSAAFQIEQICGEMEAAFRAKSPDATPTQRAVTE